MNMTELVADGHKMMECFTGLPFVNETHPVMTIDGPRMSIAINVAATLGQQKEAIAVILNDAMDKLPAEGKWWVPVFPKTFWRSEAIGVVLVLNFVLRGTMPHREDIQGQVKEPAYLASQTAFDFAGSNRRRNNE